jgi:beta-lactamase class A
VILGVLAALLMGSTSLLAAPRTPPAPRVMTLALHGTEGEQADPLGLPPDPVLTQDLEAIIKDSDLLSRIHRHGKLSMVLVDITDPANMKTAMIQPDWETFTASLSKIVVLLGTVKKVNQNPHDWGKVEERAEDMIKGSSNKAAISLFEWTGHKTIKEVTYAHGLYDDALGGIWWVPRTSFPQSPKKGLKICATARQVARYFVLMEQGRLNNPEDSKTIKGVLHNSKLALLHGGVVREEPATRYYGKPGVLHDAVSEGMLIEGDRVRYVVSVISIGTDYKDERWQDFGQELHKLILKHHPTKVEGDKL